VDLTDRGNAVIMGMGAVGTDLIDASF
jgi:hypothetical protein